MLRVLSRRAILRAVVAGGLTSSVVGCGTILYPERRGQPATRVDWAVVAMDGLLLLLFLVPGIIAFVVDFTTGAIYLPVGSSVAAASKENRYHKLQLPKDKLTEQGIAAAVSAHLKRPVRLEQDRYETRTIGSLDEFEPTAREYASLIG